MGIAGIILGISLLVLLVLQFITIHPRSREAFTLVAVVALIAAVLSGGYLALVRFHWRPSKDRTGL